MSEPATPFHDLERYVALPRLSGLALSADGSRLVTAVATLDPKRTRFVSALWELDPAGARPARRLTRSAKGEGGAAFLPDGSVLFVSSRPDPDGGAAEGAGDDEPAALWVLPAGGGEARAVAHRPGGIGGVAVARASGTVVVGSPTLPAATTADDDAARRKARKDRKVSAILHETYPVRYWDHDLGPERTRLLTARAPSGAGPLELRDLTGHVGGAIGPESRWDVTPDGAAVVVVWTLAEAGGGQRDALAVIDLATGERRLLVDDPDHEHAAPRVSPDGTQVAAVRQRRSTAGGAPQPRLVVVDLADGAVRPVASSWDRWPGDVCWTPDGRALLVTADDRGSCPVFRVDVDSGAVVRLTGDRGAYGDVVVAPDGVHVYAVRSGLDAAPHVVRFDARSPGQQPVALPGPAPLPERPGTLTEVTATAVDGTPLRAWLVLPDGASPDRPAPLLVWIHGGPLGSWNAWAWRWNPWLPAAHGYAVLLPDPALSTGYGQAFIERGWGAWGSAPYTDVLALTDAAVARPDIDAGRTAAMGGSFGGYMANWVAGHTDRFACIVTHASLWALDQFGPTTDGYPYWRREMTPAMAGANSPHRFVDQIRTPMLVIHGHRDYRVPIGEGLRLWAELAERSAGDDGTMPHKFLYFPDENHWVLGPQHAIVWYRTVFAFVDHHVLGHAWVTPDVLQ